MRTDISRLEQRAADLAPQALGSPVEEADLAHVIELWTGIPASRIQESELKKLSHIEETLNRRIIGQKEAVAAVSAAIAAAAASRSAPAAARRRLSSSARRASARRRLVKVLSEELFDKPETLIRLDMSRIHGKAQRLAHHRLAARLRRLR